MIARTKARHVLIAFALSAAACSPPASDTAPAPASEGGVPPDIAAVASAATPGIRITSGEQDGDEYEVAGTMPNGDEVELDLVRSNGTWSVLEIQRDVPWSSVPEPVRAAAAASRNPVEPARVIESRQAADGAIVYELFSAGPDGRPSGGPAMEVRWHQGKAAVITPAP